MWLAVPETIEHVLYEGSLEPATPAGMERLTRELKARGPGAQVRAGEDLPVVSIGQPEVWPLAQVYPPDKMPKVLCAALKKADFYLVRFACSFRMRKKRVEVEWARFTARLAAPGAQDPAIAFDLHPLRVTQEVKHDVRVTLGPTLKFQEIEAGAGQAAFGLSYTELQPLISANGVGEERPSWDYESVRGVMVQGSKFMHALVKAPKGATRIQATLDLSADVKVYASVLGVLLIPYKEQPERTLTVTLV